MREMDIAQHNSDFQSSWKQVNLPREANNVFEHWCYFKDESKKTPLLRDDRLKEPKPCIIIGSGPSFDDAAPLLKNWKGGIICSSSHLTNLAYYGCYPTYFAAPDPRNHDEELTGMPEAELKALHEKTTFVQCPIGPISYTRLWEGRMRWFLIMDPSKEWYANAIAPNFSWITESLLPFSSNSPAILALAQFLGYAPIYLAGTDYSGKRFDNWLYTNGQWVEGKGTLPPEASRQKTYHGLDSDMNLMWAWRGMLCTLRLAIDDLKGTYWHVYNCGPNGALKDNLPYRDITKVIATQGEGERMNWTKDRTRTELDVGLARFNTFCFRVHNGEFAGDRLEMAGSWDELGARIDAINKTLDMSLKLYDNVPPEDIAKVRKEFKPEKIRKVDKDKALEYCRYLKERIK